MKLQQRLALHYGGVVAVALAVLGGLLFHEFITEERLRTALPPERQSEVMWGDATEVVVYSTIPAILILGWWLTRRSLLPLTALAKRVERTDVGSLRQPIPRTMNGDEVDRLAAAFNTMATRIEGSFQQIREFTLHASHELKTPLTVMRAEVETVLARAHGSPHAEIEALHRIVDEIDRLTRIVNGLSLLTRADAGEVRLDSLPLALGDLVREGADDARILAEPHHITVQLQSCPDVTIVGDRHRLRQMLLNLIDNAVKYNREGGLVTLRLDTSGAWAEIEVSNTGEEIPEELRARMFERFVRGERARQVAGEGCGLGLAIVEWVVQAHGGTIQVASGPERTAILIRLPVVR